FLSVGAAIGVSDDTTQTRVAPALDKHRELLSQRGIRTTAAALSVAISANAVQAAPVGLTVTISAAALAGTAVSTATVVAATTKTIAMTTFQKALVTAAIAAVAGAGLYEAHRAAQLRDQVQTLHQKQTPLQEQIHQLQRERDEAVGKLAALTDDNERLTRNSAELLRLRGEVGVLRKRADELRNENFHLQNHFQSNSVAALNPVKPPVVAKVIIKRIKQPQTVEEELIRREISVKPGNLFERASVDADVRKLYDTGWFSNIRVVEGNSTEGVTLNYLLQEKPKLTQIRFSGNTRFDEQVLAGFTSCKAGQLMDERTFSEDAQRIQELYVKLGFPNAKVKTVSNVNEDVGEGDVTFEIVE
ncbi:MAG TPA: POTRA domain-containing protein, partial [Verrucomicrobiota bacterium]|nr:POTRA domain-containing protein [Verrucomicrobiota bacterium]